VPTESIKLNNPKLTLALTQQDLTAGGVHAECQAQVATLTPTGVSTTTAATGCRPASQSAGKSTWAMNVQYLQDWATATGVSQFALTNDGKTVWYRLEPDPTVYGTLAFEGQLDMVAGAVGGNIGDGTEVNATSVWPMKGPPTVTRPAPLAADETAEPQQLVDA
jgi:hypothetical protein